MVMFSSNGPKDSATFASSGGEFVWNLATYGLREQMNLTSKALAARRERVRVRRAGDGAVASGRPAARGRHAGRARMPRDAARSRSARRTSSRSARSSASTSTSATSSTGASTRPRMRPIARCGYRGDYAVVTELFEMSKTVKRFVGREPRGPAWIALMLVEAVGGLLVGGSLACAASTFVRATAASPRCCSPPRWPRPPRSSSAPARPCTSRPARWRSRARWRWSRRGSAARCR